MTHYSVDYGKMNLSRKDIDKRAIRDIFDYLGNTDRMEIVIRAAKSCKTASHVSKLGMQLAMFAGVSGYPFHALCRKYCLKAFREWMHRDDDPVWTDEEGFIL